MNITHTWIIKNLTQINDGTGTVTQVAYKVVSRDTETGTATFTIDYCELDTKNINQETFIPYSSLTEDTVIEFVKTTLGDEKVEKIEKDLADQIINKINPPTPPVITENLPWS